MKSLDDCRSGNPLRYRKQERKDIVQHSSAALIAGVVMVTNGTPDKSGRGTWRPCWHNHPVRWLPAIVRADGLTGSLVPSRGIISLF